MPKQTLTVFIILFISCSGKHRDTKAIRVVEQCIEQHGGKNYQHMDVSFDFRQFRIHIKQNNGVFLYERTSKDSFNNVMHDVLTNETFKREVNGKQANLSQKDADKYREGLNAIAYFVLLPYKLSEPAVKLKFLGAAIIENKKYDKISVSFEETGGGKDHLDEFCYWINQDSHSLDFLAYSNGGPRFRKAIKKEIVAGITFQDYENYEVADSSLQTYDYDKAFINGKVKLLSKVEQTNYTFNK